MGRLECPFQRRALSPVEGVPFVIEHETEHRALGEVGLLVEHKTASGD